VSAMSTASYNIDQFVSRRSPVFARNAMVAGSHPLATLAGIRMMLRGGNAIDAAVAAAAVLGVVQPYQTGLGGDAFALIYLAATREVEALNASGPAPAAARLEDYRAHGFTEVPKHSPYAWTVPGCVDGWCQMLERHGRLPLAAVLEPAIQYAEYGFPVAPGDAASWKQSEARLRQHAESRRVLLVEDNAPRPGDVLIQRELGRTLRRLATGGRDEFYRGEIAERLVAYSRRQGGLLTLDDLAAYRAEWQRPIEVKYRGVRILECPPNGQGLAALIALRLMSALEHDLRSIPRDSPECLHLLIEAMKCGMVAAARYVADPRFEPVPVEELLSEQFRMDHPLGLPATSPPGVRADQASNTVYLAVVDPDGNAVSFINSIYDDFGSGHTADDLGFLMQNRGADFSLDPGHPNRLAPRKRPYHTIIPAMVLDGDALHTVFGVTGGFMQPQGHLQVLVSLLNYALDEQTALDLPRFWWKEGRRVLVEDGFPPATYDRLRAWGHEITRQGHRGMGGGQIIRAWPDRRVLVGASEPRQDGCAMGY
jgi:gamma-glutamyltranspeptidase / glutathione hydrolase